MVRLKEANRLIVTTARDTYELLVIDPQKRLVQVTSSDPRLNCVIGQLVASILGPEQSERRVYRPGWIGFNMRMQIQFRNHLLTCSPTVSLRVEGEGDEGSWHYDVF